jgi:hypothetical protein
MKIRFLLFTFFLLSGFFSCKKYEDGGKHFLAGKTLIKKWTLVQYTVDGVDSLQSLDPRFLAEQVINIYDGNHKDYSNTATTLRVGSSFSCTLSFADYNKQLQFHDHGFFGGSRMPQSPFLTPPDEWEIIQLTKDIVKLRMVYNKEYVIVLN